MRRFLPLLPAVLLCGVAPAPVATGPVLSVDSEARWIPFDLTPANQIRFTATIDGRPASAILDTGVSVTAVSRSFANAAGMKSAGQAEATAIGGSVAVGIVRSSGVRFGGLSRGSGRMALIDLAATATGGVAEVDALIGADLTGCCALDIDYDARRFRMLPSGRMPFAGTQAPLRLLSPTDVYASEITLAGRRIRPVLVDTGDGSSLSVTARDWRAAAPKVAGVSTVLAYGLLGPVVSEIAVAPEIRIGPLTARDVEVRIEPERSFAAPTGTAGRIGSGLLGRYRVLLDPRAGHMVLQPGRNHAVPPLRSTSGLLVGYASGQLRVLHVMRGGPAAAAGWQQGDAICTVDGTPVIRSGSNVIDTRWAAGEPGRTIRFGMCDGGERELVLRRFY